ncbi:NAD(+) synthase [Helicobacter baculiformis]|uniref:NH(3)-dependent NAD(+) synthetase n=1 Tax=Helicobacter baculiformis TaxID=427351 RepID=A0ABV7ZKI6_9HELI|nr:NAD(+) synthase [Helicobacter baculiformis]
MKNTLDQLLLFLQTQSAQRGFKRFLVGMSGGVDSALVGVLCQKVLPTHALIMPATHSSSATEDAILLCERFNIPHTQRPIAPYEALFKEQNPNVSLGRLGNFCARMRMNLLYDFSVEIEALVVGTSNKSEIMLGYGTLFGDLAWLINPIAHLFKSQVYTLARALEIPANILNKPPSADLYSEQSDEADLGFSYALIDPLLAEISARWDRPTHIESRVLCDLGYAPDLVASIVSRVQKNAFKSQPPSLL